MERSLRFISLNGMSGVGAGVVALAGTAIGHYYLQQQYGKQDFQRLFETLQGKQTSRTIKQATVHHYNHQTMYEFNKFLHVSLLK